MVLARMLSRGSRQGNPPAGRLKLGRMLDTLVERIALARHKPTRATFERLGPTELASGGRAD